MKIDIIGSVASGKTTLAKKVSEKYNMPYYEKDNVVWMRTNTGDKKRSEQERDDLFKSIIAQENWIVEGSPRKILKESYECCDYIIFLDIPVCIRLQRVFLRWIRQRKGKEKYNSKPTFRFLYYNIKWVLEFNKLKISLLEEMKKYDAHVAIFKNDKEAYDFLVNIVESDYTVRI